METHAQRHPFEYALLRVVPRIERGEAINAGVLLYSRPLDFLGARVHLDVPRLRALDPAADPVVIERVLESVVTQCGDGRTEAARYSGPERLLTTLVLPLPR
jgi:hypothetical protein